ncbi:MAG: choice-of-anchor F family protein [Psychromonas sp.]
MKILSFKHKDSTINLKLFCKRITLLAVISAISIPIYAGKIVSTNAANGAQGFGGWNLDNVEVLLNGDLPGDSSFNEVDGSYEFPLNSDYTYSSDVSDDDSLMLGQVLAKTWPVGEPSGIKIINNDSGVKNGKPENCIMATSYLEGHYLDSVDPQQVTCSSPFQTHKRYKLAMLPATTAGGAGYELPIDLVFNVEDGDASDYQVFQKINNWTNLRLQGFTIQVGFGIGSNFSSVTASDSGVSIDNLYLSIPADIFSPTQLATFSAGLFGPEDKHTGKRGFLDANTRAGFLIDEYGTDVKTDILHGNKTLGSDYANVPPGAGDSPENQFGPWLPNIMLPYGIFFDDDGNPATDAALIAWYGYNPETSGLGWMGGALEGFADKSDEISEMGQNLLYTMGEIDDLVNVGLNYIVTIGDVANFPNNTFTIRIKPIIDTSEVGSPSYIDSATGDAITPMPELTYSSVESALEISPSPEFVTGELITVRVGDKDLEDFADVKISATNNDGSIVIINEETFTLVEQGEGRAVFAGTLPDKFSDLPAGSQVIVRYSDADPVVILTESITAIDEPIAPPIYAKASITSLSVPETLQNGLTRNLKVSIINDKESAALASGSVLLTGSDGSEFTADFTDLRLGGKLKLSFSWTAELADPDVAKQVEWNATLRIQGDDLTEKVVDDAYDFTSIEVKKGKNSKK